MAAAIPVTVPVTPAVPGVAGTRAAMPRETTTVASRTGRSRGPDRGMTTRAETVRAVARSRPPLPPTPKNPPGPVAGRGSVDTPGPISPPTLANPTARMIQVVR